MQSGKKLVIIAEDVEGEALSTLIVNRLRGTLQRASCVKAPGFGDRRKEMLQDIAILTGGQVISERAGLRAEGAPRSTMLGRARQVKVDKENTIIVDGAGDKRGHRRAAWRRSAPRSTTTTSDYDKEKLQERLAKLAGGVAVIKVGAATETEMKEKKLRIEDALNATTRGCGRGHRRRRRHRAMSTPSPLSRSSSPSCRGRREDRCSRSSSRRCRSPIRQIAANAGIDGSVIFEKIKTQPQGRLRLRRLQGSLLRHDLRRYRRSRQRSPAPRWRTLRPSASMVLTTEALVADKPEPPAPAAPGAGMGDMGGMY